MTLRHRSGPILFLAGVLLLTGAASARAQEYRTEHDLLGDKQIPAEAYYGVQTARALENFQISGLAVNHYPELVNALALVKLAAARANADAGALDQEVLRGIEMACEAVMAGEYHDQFLVDLYQGGAGTSTNMCANEVLANAALEKMGHEKGKYDIVEPHDDLNMSQSTNDFYPTALKVAMLRYGDQVIEELEQLARSFEAKGEAFSHILKMGRTEMQDAVPMTLGQEFRAFGSGLRTEIAGIRRAETALYAVNMGGTAIGTGLNAAEGFPELCAAHLAELTGKPIVKADDLIAATIEMHGFVTFSSALRALAVKLNKIAGDLILLCSGPRTGLYEIRLPAMQPGSSIMPGKVNPVMPELVNCVAFQVIGNDLTVAYAASCGQLQLNAYEPVMAASILESEVLLINTLRTLRSSCIDGIEANEDVTRQHVERSIGIVTALNPVLGYDRATELAAEAMTSGKGILELVREKKLLSEAEIEKLLDPMAMTGQ
ncbi:MAG: aspartate ammonia-lyase [Planctomycetota bacterium]|jgi:aspartate ammonia-lyase